MREQKRDYVFLSATMSLCSECLTLVPAKVIQRNNSIYLLKNCREHGIREALLEEDSDFYHRRREYDVPGTVIVTQTKSSLGCPYDCGLCPDHEQHTCIALLEVTQFCNLRCPVCYAESGDGYFISLSEVDSILDAYQNAESGKAQILQISGGEPTLHPRILDIIRMAKDKKIRYVMLNTNGVRIANNLEFASALAEFRDGFEVYLQFDGFDAKANRSLRGKNLTEIKMRALENLARFNVPVTLVTTVFQNGNDSCLGEIMRFGLANPTVRGVNFQPVAYFGRVEGVLPENRITLTGVLKRLEEQTH